MGGAAGAAAAAEDDEKYDDDDDDDACNDGYTACYGDRHVGRRIDGSFADDSVCRRLTTTRGHNNAQSIWQTCLSILLPSFLPVFSLPPSLSLSLTFVYSY